MAMTRSKAFLVPKTLPQLLQAIGSALASSTGAKKSPFRVNSAGDGQGILRTDVDTEPASHTQSPQMVQRQLLLIGSHGLDAAVVETGHTLGTSFGVTAHCGKRYISLRPHGYLATAVGNQKLLKPSRVIVGD